MKNRMRNGCMVVLFGLLFVLIGCSMGAQDAQLDFGKNQVSEKTVAVSAVNASEEEIPDGLTSELYDVELDSSYDEPVTIKIPVTEEVSSEDETLSPFLAIGTEVTFEDGNAEIFYQYAETEVTDGQATASFIPSDYTGGTYVHGSSGGEAVSGTPSREKLRLGIIWCSTTYADGGHFIVYFPAKAFKVFISNNDREALLDDLEAVYDQYLQAGYTYSKRSSWPITVNIQNISDEGYYTYGFDGAGGSISINKKFFDGGYQPNAVKPLLAHEFFHFVQLNYETTSTDNLWFDEATATYFESKASGVTPTIVSEYKNQIFTGVIPADNTSANGYARMPLIAYMAGRNQETFIKSAYEMVKEGADWESALLSSMGPSENWAGEFYKELVSGNVGDYVPYTIYSNLSKNQMAELGSFVALKVPSEDEIKKASEDGEVPELGKATLNIDGNGAKLLAVTIDDTNLKQLPEDMNPSVQVSGNASVTIFRIKGKSFETFDGGNTEGIELADFVKSMQDKEVFLILVTGLHENGKQDYEVTISMPTYPTLDELVGTYSDGSVYYKEIHVADELKEKMNEAAAETEEGGDEQYCDLNVLAMIEEMEGQTKPATLVIAKTGEDTGTLLLQYEGTDTDSSDAIPFTYTNGTLIIDDIKTEESMNAVLSGNLKAAYGKNKDVCVNGSLYASFESAEVSVKDGALLKIEIVVSGSKLL